MELLLYNNGLLSKEVGSVMAQSFSWWQTGVIYQIYPRSFMDSNADGVGDLAGIRQRLDYLSWLGVDTLWLSPIYPSPMADFGYDIKDYQDIDPLFGSLDDFDRLLQDMHQRKMKLVLDFVPNHTAVDHRWVDDHPEHYVQGTEQDIARTPWNYLRVKQTGGDRIRGQGWRMGWGRPEPQVVRAHGRRVAGRL